MHCTALATGTVLFPGKFGGEHPLSSPGAQERQTGDKLGFNQHSPVGVKITKIANKVWRKKSKINSFLEITTNKYFAKMQYYSALSKIHSVDVSLIHFSEYFLE